MAKLWMNIVHYLILFIAIHLGLSQKFFHYGIIEKRSAKWSREFNLSTALESGTGVYRWKPTMTYACRVWHTEGEDYARVGRYVPQTQCCSLSHENGHTECSRRNIEFLIKQPSVNYSWVPARDGIFHYRKHRGLLIGAAKEYRDQFICRFWYVPDWMYGGRHIRLQGSLSAGSNICIALFGFAGRGSKEVTSTKYELLVGLKDNVWD